MHLRASCLVLTCLTWSAFAVAAQSRAPADSDLSRGIGHWTAAGVSFQSGGRAHAFAVDVQRKGDQLQATLPPELKLEGGQTYLLDRVSAGVFRHVDGAGRIVELTLTELNRASLLVTGSGGEGRITWQLTGAP